ncbi:autophagy protein Apg12 [Trichuris suis]|nr:autophagy protein Apg12 [Trichuris suis]
MAEEGTSSPSVPGKIELILKPVGDAPIMKDRKWEVATTRTVAWLHLFIRKYLKLNDAESLFLYVSQCFCLSNDYTLENVYDCFGSNGKLVLHYSVVEAWG